MTIQEQICDPHDPKAKGESRDEDDGAPSAHRVRWVVADDEERCDECRSGEENEPGEDGEDVSEDVHCIAPFVAGTSGDKDILPER